MRFTALISTVSTGAARTALAALVTAALVMPVHAQTVPAPQPVESQPLPPPAAAPTTPAAPSATLAEPTQAQPAQGQSATPSDPTPGTPSASPAPATPPVTAQPAPAAPPSPGAQNAGIETLVPPSRDPSMPDKVELASKPAALLRGASTWDDGYDKLTAAFTKLQDAMTKFGIPITGKPVAVFLETDDLGFRFEAQLPIERAPAERSPELAADIRFGLTPSGRAWRFVHRAPYDEIDSTYEAITAYLDQRGIDAKEAFIEEYVTLGQGPADDGLEINIFVQPLK